MNYQEEIKRFVIKGFENVHPSLNIQKSLVLDKKEDNFIKDPKAGYDYHRWARSLKSSQAFAFNIFSGIVNPSLEFEFHMKVFDRDAQIDVKFENNHTIELFEVKAFEIVNMGAIQFEEKYFTKTLYRNSDIAEPFIKFIKEVIDFFKKDGSRIYGGGVKQLCSHILGILNTMNNPDSVNKKFKLYSLCFDNSFNQRFELDLNNYRKTLEKFKILVDKFLNEIKVDTRVEYCGFLSASDFINNNEVLLGKENFDYVLKRYFYKN
ncbi:MAG: hypothetical protein V1775_18885 [Bacteroidota bacterium]